MLSIDVWAHIRIFFILLSSTKDTVKSVGIYIYEHVQFFS